MSTRCQIFIYEVKAGCYVHSDGYPSGILPTLLPFVRNFKAKRGWDPEYMLARLVSFQCQRNEGYIGVGVTDGLHGDEDFVYTIKDDFTVVVTKLRGSNRKSVIYSAESAGPFDDME